MATQDNENILHEVAVEDSVKEELERVGEVGHTGDAISNASVAHALNATFSDTEVENALNDIGSIVNDILSVLRANGIVAEA